MARTRPDVLKPDTAASGTFVNDGSTSTSIERTSSIVPPGDG